MTWPDWIEHHTTLFPAMRRDGNLATIAAWATVFVRIGATPADAVEASSQLAMNDVPDWPENHLRFLRERLLEAVARRRPVEQAAPELPGCRICDETGYASVPTATAMAGGKWYTVAVCCRCPLGLHLAKTRPAGRSTLREYEEVYPNWRDADAKYRAGLREWAEAQTMSVGMGKAVGKIVADLRRRDEIRKRTAKETPRP